jgi:hypothetical protein
VKYIAPFVLGHRITLSHEAKIAGRKPRDIVNSIIAGIAVPVQDSVEGMESFLEETEASSKLTASPKKSFAHVANVAKPAKKPAVQQQVVPASTAQGQVTPGKGAASSYSEHSVTSESSAAPQVAVSSQGKPAAPYTAAPAVRKSEAAAPQHEYAVVASSDDATRYAATSARDLVAVPVVMGADGSYHRVEDKASFSVPGKVHACKDASNEGSASLNSVASMSTVSAFDQGHSAAPSSAAVSASEQASSKAQQIDNGQSVRVPLDGAPKDQPIRVSLGDAPKDQPIRISL